MKKITFGQFFFKLDAPKKRDLFRGKNKMTDLIMFPCFPTRKGLTWPKEQVPQYSCLVEVGLKAQNAIWNFRVPRDHKHFPTKFLFLGAFLSQPCGHKHFFKKIFFILLPSFHSPWINVIVINYIDNKRNSIAIHFIFCCHKYKYSRWSGWARFCLAIIITIMEGLGLFFSCCHKYSRWWDLFAFWSQAPSQ